MTSLVHKLTSALLPKLLRCGQPTALTARAFDRVRGTNNRLISAHNFSTSGLNASKKSVSVTFLLADGDRHTVDAKVGDNLLDVIIDHDVDIDGFGACEGTLACSTCHLVFKPEDFAKIPDEATDEELDMLDLAYGLTEFSRLGCQVILTKDMDGLEVSVPGGIADARRAPL